LPEPRVLVIEDEENLVEALRISLEREGFEVFTAQDGGDGLSAARQIHPDLIVLDVMLPTMDGFEVCRILRRESDTPILILTAKGEEIDRVVGLELGADDYVTKPFSMREVVARIRGMLRRSRAAPSRADAESGHPSNEHQVLRAGDVEVDVDGHTARLKGEPLSLTPREFDLLVLLLSNKGRALSRDQILEQVWGHDYIGETRTVDVHIRWLREKIQADLDSPQRIITIRGVGYRFEG
jgi:DNA-binding response OmpR family regulator